MDHEFRHIVCGSCNKKLRFKIAQADYGKGKKVKCPGCQTINRVEIPVPQKETKEQTDESLMESLQALDDLLGLVDTGHHRR